MKTTLLALLGFILLFTTLAANAQRCFDFTYALVGEDLIITGYTGPGGELTIPGSCYAEDVIVIGDYAFANKATVTSVTIAGSILYIGNGAFQNCASLTSVTIGGSIASIGDRAFNHCTSLTAITVDAANADYSSLEGVLFNKSQTTLIQCQGAIAGSYAIPGSVAGIKGGAFGYCSSLTSVTIPNSVTSIGNGAFYSCISLREVFFKGDAPSVGSEVFSGATNVTVYYLPGTTGWGTTFAGRPAVLWNPRVETSDGSFGVGSAGFGFNITGTADIPIVVEASTTLANADWVPLLSLNLTNGAFYFSDPNWTNYPARNYRLRSP